MAGDLSRVHPAPRPIAARIGSSRSLRPECGLAGTENGWMDECQVASKSRPSAFDL